MFNCLYILWQKIVCRLNQRSGINTPSLERSALPCNVGCHFYTEEFLSKTYLVVSGGGGGGGCLYVCACVCVCVRVSVCVCMSVVLMCPGDLCVV